MGRGVSSGGGQSSLGYLFGSGEAPAPKPVQTNVEAAPSEAPAVNNSPAPKPAVASPPVDVTKQIPAGIHSTSTNNYMRADGQNTGNFITVWLYSWFLCCFPNAIHRDIGILKIAQNCVSLKESRQCYKSWYLFHLKLLLVF